MKLAISKNLERAIDLAAGKLGFESHFLGIDLIRQGLLRFADNLETKAKTDPKQRYRTETIMLAKNIQEEIHSDKSIIYQ